jgi:Peptidase family S41/N-terminal domain of Peptidase_S41 in eukaryotic IRBP
MSEKIYAWLLRLYPRHFRESYGEEVLQLFRDRRRQERGFFPSLRLWLDLIADLAVTVPCQYRRGKPAVAGASGLWSPDSAPSFRVLEGESPNLGALLLGGVLSLAAATAWVPISRVVHDRPFLAASKAHPPAYVQWAASSRDSGQRTGDTTDRTAAPVAARLDATERQRVVGAVIANLKEHYIDAAGARKIAETLLAHEKAGDYDSVTDGAAFAALLTRQLRAVSHEQHLEVVYSRNTLPDHATGPGPERLARYRTAMEENHCTFEKVQVLPHNIGYLKLNSFPEPSICEPTATAAMASLNHADAIIFDLRDNRGGYPVMVMLIAAYLFDHPEYMYTPRDNTTELSWTRSPVPGNRLADKPVYVLTSGRTFSGAEHFSYDLKMLKRATLVGERTGGATDVGMFHRIDDHFGIGIRETKAINPFSESDWAVTGVEPDVKVNAAEALATAEKLAQTKLLKKY